MTLKNGKKILIGTQKKEEIERVLETYKHKISPNEKTLANLFNEIKTYRELLCNINKSCKNILKA